MTDKKTRLPGIVFIILAFVGAVGGFMIGSSISDDKLWSQYLSWVFGGLGLFGFPLLVASIFDN